MERGGGREPTHPSFPTPTPPRQTANAPSTTPSTLSKLVVMPTSKDTAAAAEAEDTPDALDRAVAAEGSFKCLERARVALVAGEGGIAFMVLLLVVVVVVVALVVAEGVKDAPSPTFEWAFVLGERGWVAGVAAGGGGGFGV